MKQALFLTSFALGAMLSSAVPAQTYQWKDGNGHTIISDTPPPRNAREARTLGTAPAPSIGATSEAQSLAEKDAEFKKRRQEAKEKAEKAEKEQNAARDRQENCERAKRNLASLESNQVVARPNERGEREVLDDSQRAQELDNARRMVSEVCK